MSRPDIRYYARLDYDDASGITPKYVISAQAGFYPPMDALKGRDGRTTMYLLEKLSEKSNAPAMRLQARASLNFTGLKDYYVDGGRISGYAYGYPSDVPTYGRDRKRNPFYDYRQDGFLFVIHTARGTMHGGCVVPDAIEMLVLEGAKVLISAFCKQLQMGGFDGVLEELRRQVGRQ